MSDQGVVEERLAPESVGILRGGGLGERRPGQMERAAGSSQPRSPAKPSVPRPAAGFATPTASCPPSPGNARAEPVARHALVERRRVGRVGGQVLQCNIPCLCCGEGRTPLIWARGTSPAFFGSAWMNSLLRR